MENSSFKLVPIGLIHDNPFQPRLTYGLEGIEALALDIQAMRETRPETLGLLQVPLARPGLDDGRVELAFGHRRVRAFRWLAERDTDGQWHEMPLILDETLSDEAMYEIAVRENMKREDLSVIEQARAMQRGREELGYSQEDLGEQWGLSVPAVSNKLRLLQLPEEVQAFVHEGKLGEQHGRALLPLVQRAGNEAVAVRMARKAVNLGWASAALTVQVANEISRITRKIDGRLLGWGDWGEVELPPACVEVCAECEGQRKGLCTRSKAYDDKLKAWQKRLLAIARERTGLKSMKDWSPALSQAVVRYAQDCTHLRVASNEWSSPEEWVAPDLPGIVYCCTKKYGCDCRKDVEKVEELAANPERVAWQAWRDEQAEEARKLYIKAYEALKHQYQTMLADLSQRRVALLVALVKEGAVDNSELYPMPYDNLETMAETLARLVLDTSPRNLVGQQMLKCAEAFGYARLATPIDEVKARLRIIQDELKDAEGRGYVASEYFMKREAERIDEILKAHPGHAELEIELECLRQEFSREK